MFLSKLFSPKWKSEDPATRMRGIQRLSKPVILHRMVSYDPDAPVREMAKQRLEQLEKEALKMFVDSKYDNVPGQHLSAQMEFVTSQSCIAQLAKDGRKMKMQMLALAKCWDKAVLDEVIKSSGNFPPYAVAMHQKWFLQECEKHGNCDPAELMRWLAAGRRVPIEYADDYAQCTRCFRSVAVLNTKTESERYKRRTRTTISRSFDLEENEDHFYYHAHRGGVSEHHMMRTAKVDRKKKGKQARNIVVVEHKDWNRWVIELFPNKTVLPLNPLKSAFVERLSDMKARANDWLPNHFVPLSWFLFFRDENEKEAIEHFLEVRGRVRRP